MRTHAITFDVMLNGMPYKARTLLAPVGGHAQAYVFPEVNGFKLPIAITFFQGAVIEDERQAAEAKIRSFERNEGRYAFVHQRYFSVWDHARFKKAPPVDHYLQPEPVLDEVFLAKNEWIPQLSDPYQIPVLVITNLAGFTLFEITDPALAQQLITRYNARVTERKRITPESLQPHFSTFFHIDQSA